MVYYHSSPYSLARTSPLHDRNEICLALCTTAAPFKMRSLFDRKRHVVDVTVNLRCSLEGNRLSADDA